MKLRSLVGYIFISALVLGAFSLPLEAQVTLSTSSDTPEGSKPMESPFLNSPAAADSPFVGESNQTTGPVVESYSPSVPFPSGLAYEIFGYDSSLNKSFNCYTVLYGMAGYQNAQAQGSCYEAQTACLRFGLLQQFLKTKKKKQLTLLYPGSSFSHEDLESMLSDSLRDVKLKLTGCAVAIAASTITDSVIDQAGFPPPAQSQDKATNTFNQPSLQ